LTIKKDKEKLKTLEEEIKMLEEKIAQFESKKRFLDSNKKRIFLITISLILICIITMILEFRVIGICSLIALTAIRVALWRFSWAEFDHSNDEKQLESLKKQKEILEAH
jgi:cell division protein FtsB